MEPQPPASPSRTPIDSIAQALADRATLAEVTARLAARADEEAHNSGAGRSAVAACLDACATDIMIARANEMNLAFNRMIKNGGCSRRAAAIMVLAVLSPSERTREECRAWCEANLSADNCSGMHHAITGAPDAPVETPGIVTKIVPSVPARQ